MVPGVPEWMVWNSFLAAVPAALAVPLFRVDRRPRLGWWALLAAFVAFLPNAPYVLTDVIHLRGHVEATETSLHLAVVFAAYAGFFAFGVGCYAFAVARLERWLRHRGWSWPRVLAVELALHGLCAVGVFLGRVFRFNSWDLAARPSEVLEVVRVPRASTVVVLVGLAAVLASASAGGTIIHHRSRVGR